MAETQCRKDKEIDKLKRRIEEFENAPKPHKSQVDPGNEIEALRSEVRRLQGYIAKLKKEDLKKGSLLREQQSQLERMAREMRNVDDMSGKLERTNKLNGEEMDKMKKKTVELEKNKKESMKPDEETETLRDEKRRLDSEVERLERDKKKMESLINNLEKRLERTESAKQHVENSLRELEVRENERIQRVDHMKGRIKELERKVNEDPAVASCLRYDVQDNIFVHLIHLLEATVQNQDFSAVILEDILSLCGVAVGPNGSLYVVEKIEHEDTTVPSSPEEISSTEDWSSFPLRSEGEETESYPRISEDGESLEEKGYSSSDQGDSHPNDDVDDEHSIDWNYVTEPAVISEYPSDWSSGAWDDDPDGDVYYEYPDGQYYDPDGDVYYEYPDGLYYGPDGDVYYEYPDGQYYDPDGDVYYEYPEGQYYDPSGDVYYEYPEGQYYDPSGDVYYEYPEGQYYDPDGDVDYEYPEESSLG